MKLHEVVVPQLGANDSEVTINEWKIQSGTRVSTGDEIAELETTKASFALLAENNGFIYFLVEEGGVSAVSSVVALITAQEDQALVDEWVAARKYKAVLSVDEFALAGVTLTKKALELARRLAIKPEQLPNGRILREVDVAKFADGSSQNNIYKTQFKGSNKLIIYGAGKGAQTILETVRAMGGIDVVGFVVTEPESVVEKYYGLAVFNESQLEMLFSEGVTNFIAAITDRVQRLNILTKAQEIGFNLFNAIHPRSYLSPTCVLRGGIHVKAGAVIDTSSFIGYGCIVDNGVIIPHHNTILDGVHLAPGVCLGSSITIGERSLLGVGVCIDTGIEIGSDVIVAPGSAVTRNLPNAVIAEGVPARITGERRIT